MKEFAFQRPTLHKKVLCFRNDLMDVGQVGDNSFPTPSCRFSVGVCVCFLRPSAFLGVCAFWGGGGGFHHVWG